MYFLCAGLRAHLQGSSGNTTVLENNVLVKLICFVILFSRKNNKTQKDGAFWNNFLSNYEGQPCFAPRRQQKALCLCRVWKGIDRSEAIQRDQCEKGFVSMHLSLEAVFNRAGGGPLAPAPHQYRYSAGGAAQSHPTQSPGSRRRAAGVTGEWPHSSSREKGRGRCTVLQSHTQDFLLQLETRPLGRTMLIGSF